MPVPLKGRMKKWADGEESNKTAFRGKKNTESKERKRNAASVQGEEKKMK